MSLILMLRNDFHTLPGRILTMVSRRLFICIVALIWINPSAHASAALPSPEPMAGVKAAQSPIEHIAHFGRATGKGFSTLLASGDIVYAGQDGEFVVMRWASTNNLTEIARIPLPNDIVDMSISGNTIYASLAWNGIWAINVEVPYQPKILDKVSDEGGRLVIVGGVLYVGQFGRLLAFDISEDKRLSMVDEISGDWQADEILTYNTYLFLIGTGASIIDISTPGDLRFVSFFGEESVVHMAISYPYAYTLNNNSDGIHVYDLLHIDQPSLVGIFEKRIKYANAMVVGGSYLYVRGRQEWIVDISIPDRPTIVDEIPYRIFGYRLVIDGKLLYTLSERALSVFSLVDPTRPIDISPFFEAALAPEAMVTTGKHLYVLEEEILSIFDISYVNKPKLVNKVIMSGVREIYLSNDKLYAIESISSLRNALVAIFDISNPISPSRIGQYIPSTRSKIEHLDIQNNNMFVVEGGSLVIVDVSNPESPKITSQFLLPSDLPGRILLYVTIGNSIAYLTAIRPYDQETDLFAVDISDISIPKELWRYQITGITLRMHLDGSTAYVGRQVFSLNGTHLPNPILQLPADLEITKVENGYLYLVESDHLAIYKLNLPNELIKIGNYAERSIGRDGNGLRLFVKNGPFLYTKVMLVDGSSDGIEILYFLPPLSRLVSRNGGELAANEGKIHYIFPSGVFDRSAIITHLTRYSHSSRAGSGASSVGLSFELQPEDAALQINTAFTLSVSYAGLNLDSFVPESLALYYQVDDQWIMEPTSRVDADAEVVYAQPEHFVRWSLFGEPRLSNSIFLPYIVEESVDLWIQDMEVTQAIQSLDNRVPLVEKRPTVVRIYARTNSPLPIDDVMFFVDGYRNGVKLDQSPLIIGPLAVFPNPHRNLLGSTANVLLPLSWLSDEIEIRATVGVMPNREEVNYEDAQVVERARFQPVPPLEIVIVPANYTDASTGLIFPAQSEAVLSNWLFRVYPVNRINVTWHTPITIPPTMPDRFLYRLISAVGDLKILEDAPPNRIYYGIASLTDDTGITHNPPQAGPSGIGGGGVVVSYDLTQSPNYPFHATGKIAAHEIGHALGRPHPDEDTFPYPSGSIGEYGLDIASNQVWSPYGPDKSTDFMGGDPNRWWVSDYTYMAILERLTHPPTISASSLLEESR